MNTDVKKKQLKKTKGQLAYVKGTRVNRVAGFGLQGADLETGILEILVIDRYLPDLATLPILVNG